MKNRRNSVSRFLSHPDFMIKKFRNFKKFRFLIFFIHFKIALSETGPGLKDHENFRDFSAQICILLHFRDSFSLQKIDKNSIFFTQCGIPLWNYILCKSTLFPTYFMFRTKNSAFLAKLFPQLCLCHWNGNYDLFCNFVTFLALFVTFLWPFYDLFSNFMTFFVTFMTFLWPFQHFCDLFMNDKKGHNFMNDKNDII